MEFNGSFCSGIKIAYIGGGSRNWAWDLMKDLALSDGLSGTVYLYDIDYEAAKINESIGNSIRLDSPEAADFSYVAVKTIGEALSGADFVVISILPGTFDEMESDVHIPEQYGIYQSVGDTTGAGGILRAMRTVPMYEFIANAIKRYSPDAWVINYTNPMTICVRTLYKVFPQIKAFGCCHEVFKTQHQLCDALDEVAGIKGVDRTEIYTNVIGVNHFTWISKAFYRNIDLLPIYHQYVLNHKDDTEPLPGHGNPDEDCFACLDKVKFDMYLKYGVIVATSDRHLAEFLPNQWYLSSPQAVRKMRFGLTPVSFRKEHLKRRLEDSRKVFNREKPLTLSKSGEEGVSQMKAILGQHKLITNVNLPNLGQLNNLPSGAVVETNAVFSSNCVSPVISGSIPDAVYPLVAPICQTQEMIVEAALRRDLKLSFEAFAHDPQLTALSLSEKKELFDKMTAATKHYLEEYYS